MLNLTFAQQALPYQPLCESVSNLRMEASQVHRDAAIAEVFFHLGDGVVLEVGDGSHQDRVGAAGNDGIVEVVEHSGAAGLYQGRLYQGQSPIKIYGTRDHKNTRLQKPAKYYQVSQCLIQTAMFSSTNYSSFRRSHAIVVTTYFLRSHPHFQARKKVV